MDGRALPRALSLPDGLSTFAKLTIAESRLSLEVNGEEVGAWSLDGLQVDRRGERFDLTCDDGEEFAFTTVWADQLETALRPPSPLVASIINGVRRGALVTVERPVKLRRAA